MGAAHGYKDLDDFTLSLIRNSGFPDKVNDIVVECGNRKYQDILDRFIGGADVSAAEIRPVWGSTTQQMCSLSGFYERLFPLVRQLNQKLPPQKRLRVLAADPPIDWSTVTDKATWRSRPRFFPVCYIDHNARFRHNFLFADDTRGRWRIPEAVPSDLVELPRRTRSRQKQDACRARAHIPLDSPEFPN
jgi:hypothetical protein